MERRLEALARQAERSDSCRGAAILPMMELPKCESSLICDECPTQGAGPACLILDGPPHPCPSCGALHATDDPNVACQSCIVAAGIGDGWGSWERESGEERT